MYAPPIPITYRKIYHTVKKGETLASIGKRFGVSTEDMKRLNPKGAVVGEKVTMEVRAVSKAKGKPKTSPKGKPKTNVG
jgi:LysM repeat protein